MNIEQKINYQLNKYPFVKKYIKRVYQTMMYLVSDHIKSSGDIVRISPEDKDYEYFFGYYDKSPWDITGRYVLCLKCTNTWKDVSPRTPAEIVLIDTFKSEQDEDYVTILGCTESWNVQQGCMLQWLGPDYKSKIIYNTVKNGRYCSIILDIQTKEERIIDSPVYSVSQDGKVALSLDFSRLYNLRPGYGYYNIEEKTKNEALPNSTAIWKVNLETGCQEDLLTYKDFSEFIPRKEMQIAGAVHKVNHIMISPSGKRFMVLYRWFNGQRKYTRLITCDINGENMYLLSDDDMVSHCYWKDDDTILAFENKKESGTGYYLMHDCTRDFKRVWDDICNDGHPSYSPDKKYVVTDSYPDRARKSKIMLLSEENQDFRMVLAKVFAPFKYDNDTRCDLHPRWNHQGNKIAFDSVYEGKRGLYYVDVPQFEDSNKKNIVFVVTACKKSGPIEQMLSLIKYMDRSKYKLYLITLYDEPMDGSSQLDRFINHGVVHYKVPLTKKDILLGRTGRLKNILTQINADLVHSLGVFPDYAISKMRFKKHVLTIRNFVYEDYPAKFGKLRGFVLAKLHLFAIKNADLAWTCSSSLSIKYNKELGLSFPFIQNGVNIDKFNKIDEASKLSLKKKLNIPLDKTILIYAGQFVSRKNQEFLLELFAKNAELKDYALLLLGDGVEYKKLYHQYNSLDNVIFTGSVNNVNEYLQAADIYISSSRSEGLPNGVLEAMATGLPVILSDIEQHKEIYEVNNNVGELFVREDAADCLNKILSFDTDKIKTCSINSLECVRKNFSARKMSENYQSEYEQILLGRK